MPPVPGPPSSGSRPCGFSHVGMPAAGTTVSRSPSSTGSLKRQRRNDPSHTCAPRAPAPDVHRRFFARAAVFLLSGRLCVWRTRARSYIVSTWRRLPRDLVEPRKLDNARGIRPFAVLVRPAGAWTFPSRWPTCTFARASVLDAFFSRDPIAHDAVRYASPPAHNERELGGSRDRRQMPGPAPGFFSGGQAAPHRPDRDLTPGSSWPTRTAILPWAWPLAGLRTPAGAPARARPRAGRRPPPFASREGPSALRLHG